MTEVHSFVIPTNPEPWKVGPISVVRRGKALHGSPARDPNVEACQEAIHEWFDTNPHRMLTGPYQVRFYYYRQLASYTDSRGAKRHRNVADTTNMQKCVEDALQGYVIDNDRHDVHVQSFTAVQSSEVLYPCIAIEIIAEVPDQGLWPTSLFPPEITPVTKNAVKRVIMGEFEQKQVQSIIDDNEWPPRR